MTMIYFGSKTSLLVIRNGNQSTYREVRKQLWSLVHINHEFLCYIYRSRGGTNLT